MKILIIVEGTIEGIIFTNESNGYAVCEIAHEKGVVTLVGYMPFISEGEIIKASGLWVTHPDYGEQFKVEYFEKILPNTAEAIEKYLGTGIIKGIGKATARKIVKKFGDNALNVILENPEKLRDIKGMSRAKALEIGQAFAKRKNFTDIVSFLQEYGISPAYAAKVYKIFGENTIEEIRANPYRLADEIPGISFKTTDRIANSLGIDPESRLRICSGLKYVLIRAAVNGHTYLPYDELAKYGENLLGVSAGHISDALVFMRFDGTIYIEKENLRNNFNDNFNNNYNDKFNDSLKSNIRYNAKNNTIDDYAGEHENDAESSDGRVYLSDLHQAELNITRRLTALANSVLLLKIRGIDKTLEKTLKDLQQEENIILAETQKTAIKEALGNGALVITGGPGTGKTTIIKSIIKIFERNKFKVALAAPTGRAAKRMTEATGYESKTIHRLLEIGYVGEDNEISFMRTDVNPIDADVIIIDEMSMVDILLMDSLMKAIKPGSRLILVGDVDQLPSVGPGNVLKDIISSGAIRTVRLTEVFRQAEKSLIVVNAHRINRGERPILNEKSKDFFFIPRNNPTDIVNLVLDLCGRRIPSQLGYDPLRDIQVLTPTKKGLVGVGNLNIELQKELNPKNKNRNEKAFPNFTFREGDKVMQIKNNYNIQWEKIQEQKDGSRQEQREGSRQEYGDGSSVSHGNYASGNYLFDDNENDDNVLGDGGTGYNQLGNSQFENNETGNNQTENNQAENNGGEGIFNGDTGVIRQIDHDDEKIRVVFDDNRLVEYYFDAFDEIEPAYAITIHKSQGSEFPVVILPIFPGPPVLMTRNLLYTAITRARDLVIVVGLEGTLYQMIDNNRETLRYSGLADKLQKSAGSGGY